MSTNAHGDMTAVLRETRLPQEHERIAFYLPSQGDSLFAWLHVPKTGHLLRHGVVICNPMGYEHIHSHRSLRHLAEELTKENLFVLRFDYHGTGDSPGCDEDPDRMVIWQKNIQDAILWMQGELGCQRISLIGLRLGATLAALVVNEQPVDELVLWAPILNGRQYRRELKALSLTSHASETVSLERPNEIESAGFIVSGQTLNEIANLDLLLTQPQCDRALIVARDDMPEEIVLQRHLSGLGLSCEQVVGPGYADMLAVPHHTRVPTVAINRILRWLRVTRKPEPISATPISDWNLPARVSIAYSGLTCTSEGEPRSTKQIHERAMQISFNPNLFGILSEPEQNTCSNRPLILLLNAGAAYRVGPNRLSVDLARTLSAQGFRCLRMDLCGLGDSVMTDASGENNSYPATAFRDMDIAINHLSITLDTKQVVLMGLCSGAYHSFQAAARFSSSILVESVIINPLTFFWKEGMSLEIPSAKHLKDLHYYMQFTFHPKKWLKLILGQTKIGMRGAIRMLLSRMRTPTLTDEQPVDESARETLEHVLTNIEEENIPRDLTRIVKRGRRLSFFFARTDPGYSILQFAAKRSMHRLHRSGHLDLTFIENADHTFSSRGPRHQMIAAIANKLGARYKSS